MVADGLASKSCNRLCGSLLIGNLNHPTVELPIELYILITVAKLSENTELKADLVNDGVVVVPADRVVEVVEASRAREAKEATVRARLPAGELGLDVYGVRAKLEATGLKYNE